MVARPAWGGKAVKPRLDHSDKNWEIGFNRSLFFILQLCTAPISFILKVQAAIMLAQLKILRKDYGGIIPITQNRLKEKDLGF